MGIAQAYLHPSVCTPDQLAALELETGLIAVPSNRTRGIILITPEDALIREVMAGIELHDEK